MAILVHIAPFPSEPWIDALEKLVPEEKFVTLDEVTDPADISCAIIAHPPHGIFSAYRNLRLIGTVTAGVDRLLADPDLPPGVPIVRGGDPAGDPQITENIILHVLRHHRQVPAYAAAQARAEWVRLDQKGGTLTIYALLHPDEGAAASLLVGHVAHLARSHRRSIWVVPKFQPAVSSALHHWGWEPCNTHAVLIRSAAVRIEEPSLMPVQA